MSGRGPDPKELRASLVDSGWSVAPPAADAVEIRVAAELEPEESASRRLPNYDDVGQPAVTQIDTDIQTRLRAMQRASFGDSPRPPLPPPPPPSRPPPPTLPPPPALAGPGPRRSDAPLPSFQSPGPQAPMPAAAPPSAPYRLHHVDADPLEKTEVQPRGAVLPPSDPPALRTPAMPLLSVPPAPTVISALKQRVRFAGGEVPLWSLLSPMVILLVLGSAFVAAAVGRPDPPTATASASAAPSAKAPASPPSAAASAAEPDAPTAPQAPALPASSIDTEALEARHAEELTKDEALALAATRRQREVTRGAALRQKLARDPGLFKDAAVLTELRRAAEDPLTAPDALSAMAEAPGPLSADLLYEMWTGTVVRNSATELARSLVFSKEVRAKASPELAITLDLRIAETCEQNHELLPRVMEHADRRALALLAKLARRFGCGPNKRLDCYPCLRDDKAVDDAMAAVKKRREPKPFLGK